MEQQSVWLGSFRKPVRSLAILFTAVVAVLFIWLVANRVLSEDAFGVHEMIRPTGRPIVWAMLLSMAGAILFAALYFSDTKGAIEEDANGFFDILSLVTARISMILTAIIVLVMLYEVISRYVFAKPTLWANEMSLWIAGFVLLFAGQYAMQQRSHIRIYVIYDIMPRWMRKSCDVLSLVLLWGFAVALVWGGFNDAWRRMIRMETFGTAWDSPIPGTLKPAILVIICLVAVQALSNLIADWNKAPEHHVDEIDEVEIENIRKTLEK